MEKVKILIVEDESLVARDIQSVLNNLGYEVVGIVASGEKALKETQEKSPDLVMIDIALRGTMDGIRLGEEIRRSLNKPFIYLTALSDEDKVQRAKITEPFGYILKPYEQKELHAAIEMALYKHQMELKVRESEGKYRNLFENAVEGIFQTTPDGHFMAANPAVARMLGYESPGELIASRTDIQRQSYVQPEKRAEFKQLIESLGEVRNFEYQAYRKDRSIVWLSESVRAVRDPEGRILYYEGTVQDITERKRAEELIRIQRDVALALSMATSLEKGLRLCLETAIRISEMDCGGVYLVDESTGALNLIIHQGLSPEFIKSVSYYGPDSPNALLVMSGRSIFTEHLQLGVPLDEIERHEKLHAIAVIPILHENRVIGCINVASHTKTEVPLFARDALEACAAQVGSSIARLKAEDALRESEQKFKSLADNSPNMIFINHKGKILYANLRCEEVMGYKREEFYATDFNFLCLIAPEFQDVVKSSFEKHMKGRDVLPYEYTLVTKDGRRLEAIIATKLVPYGGEQAILGIVTDITERKRAEGDLERSEKRFRELWDNAPVAYHTLDTNGIITQVNQTEAKMLGYKPEEMMGKPIFDFILPEQREEARKRFKQKIEGKLVPRAESRIYLKKDGSKVYMAIDDVLERGHKGEIIGIKSTMVDMTEQKQAEEALAKSTAELRQLSKQLLSTQELERARISHELHDELGQTLTMIRINLASIRSSLPANQLAKIEDKLTEADAQTERMMEQIHELTLDLRPHMLDDLGLLPTVHWYAEKFSQKLKISVQFTPKYWKEPQEPEIKTALFRIIQEALTNIAKHAQAKNVRIQLSYHKGFFEALIEDDGRGFNQREIESRLPKELGMGLLGMKERAALLNGQYRIESQPGQGTRVHILIPWRKADEKN